MSDVIEIRVDPIAVTIEEAVRLSGLSLTTLYRANARGELVFRKHGRRTIVDYASLKGFIEAMPVFQSEIAVAERKPAKVAR
jgi:hypothetical protein